VTSFRKTLPTLK